MADVHFHPPGAPAWVDLATTDLPAAGAYYSALFGWDYLEEPLPHGVYSTACVRGREVAGLHQLPIDLLENGTQARWTPYFAAADAAASVLRARELSAGLTLGPRDAGESGVAVLLQDPTGALCALWQAKGKAGMQAAGEPGTLAWLDLATRDLPTAARFYTALLGWNLTRSVHEGNLPYLFVDRAGQRFAAMRGMEGYPPHVGPHWLLYFQVADADASAARSAELGGGQLVAPTDIPGVGRFAVLRDPQGARFAVLALRTP